MELNFINNLSDEELLELLNWCVTKQSQEDKKSSYDDSIKNYKDLKITVHNEPDRRDLNGNRYIYATTYTDDYRITDFKISTMSKKESYDKYLREFLTQKFKGEYIEALYDYLIECARAECDELEQLIGFSKKY